MAFCRKIELRTLATLPAKISKMEKTNNPSIATQGLLVVVPGGISA